MEVCDSCWDTDQLKSKEKSTSGRKHAFQISLTLSEHKDWVWMQLYTNFFSTLIGNIVQEIIFYDLSK